MWIFGYGSLIFRPSFPTKSAARRGWRDWSAALLAELDGSPGRAGGARAGGDAGARARRALLGRGVPDLPPSEWRRCWPTWTAASRAATSGTTLRLETRELPIPEALVYLAGPSNPHYAGPRTAGGDRGGGAHGPRAQRLESRLRAAAGRGARPGGRAGRARDGAGAAAVEEGDAPAPASPGDCTSPCGPRGNHPGVFLQAGSVSPRVTRWLQVNPQLAAELRAELAKAALWVTARKLAEGTVREQQASGVSSSAADASDEPPDCNGQEHHIISRPIAEALEKHETLRRRYEPRDERFKTKAKDKESHCGYQKWHREVDEEVIEWLGNRPKATPEQFMKFLREIYNRPAMRKRFPNGF